MSFSQVWTNATPSASLAVTVAPAANDLLIFSVVSDSISSLPITWPSGFTLGDSQVTSADAQSSAWAWKKATGSETTLTASTGVDTLIGFVVAHSSVDGTTPLDGVTPGKTNSDTASASPRTITTTVAPATSGADIVAIVATDTTQSVDSTTTETTTAGTTGAWTSRADLNSGFRNIAVSTAVQVSAASLTAQGSSAFTGGGNAGICQYLIVLRPSAGAADTLMAQACL